MRKEQPGDQEFFSYRQQDATVSRAPLQCRNGHSTLLGSTQDDASASQVLMADHDIATDRLPGGRHAADDSGAAALDRRLRILLPETYDVFDEAVQPVSMGSAGLKYGADGKVPWDQMWGSFCDLAMAGGPPHRGTFLQAPSENEQMNQGPGYEQVAAELCRGVGLVTGLYAEPSQERGWIQMYCTSAAMAGWLMRAIVMENVCALGKGLVLSLPASSSFRVEKEIKNVITALAKTCHYWQDHMSDEKHQAIAKLLVEMESEAPLEKPWFAHDADQSARSAAAAAMVAELQNRSGLTTTTDGNAGWLGVQCDSISAAIWMMRALAVSNVLTRRLGSEVFLPVARVHAGGTNHLVEAVLRANGLLVRSHANA